MLFTYENQLIQRLPDFPHESIRVPDSLFASIVLDPGANGQVPIVQQRGDQFVAVTDGFFRPLSGTPVARPRTARLPVLAGAGHNFLDGARAFTECGW